MYELHVNGMTCNHCVAAVSNAIRTVDASARINVDLVAHRVWVESDADLAALTSAIAAEGYAVEDGRKL